MALGFIKGMGTLLGIGGIFYFIFATGGGLALWFIDIPWYVWTFLTALVILWLAK